MMNPYVLLALIGWGCLAPQMASGQGTGARTKPTSGTALAWAFFEDASFQYAGTPYLWLGHGSLELTIDVPPRSGHVLELLWGSKNDTRDAVETIRGHEIPVRAGGYDGFRWVRVPLPDDLTGERYHVTLRRGSRTPAFIAAVRLSGKQEGRPKPDLSKKSHKIGVAVRGPLAEMNAIWNSEPPAPANPAADKEKEAAFRQAARNALRANQAFFRSRLFIDGWLQHADPHTGLIPRNLTNSRDIWNAKDSAADNYPFMVVTAAMTDRELLAGRMLDMLKTETRLTSRIGNMPDTWSFSKKDFQADEPNLEAIIFGSSEYMKDGLLAVTEWLGSCPWIDRMIGILDDVWKHAPVDTPYGKIPSTSTEVNGEMLQVTCRMYWLTGDEEYLECACRLGDYYLLGDNHLTKARRSLILIAHGGETVSGLCELYATVNTALPEKKKEYQKPLYEMLDRILEIGRNEHGMIYSAINPIEGTNSGRIVDTWGYTYNAYYTVYMVDKTEKYREAVLKAMGNMKKHYTDYRWEGGSNDGFSDSIEGALNLYNRERVETIPEWIDHEILHMFRRQKPGGVIEGWHGDGNSARTWLMYALWKTQGLTIRPWRKDVRFGATMYEGDLCISLVADQPWTGRLHFDIPRHRDQMHLPLDYPRLNQFPEWFTVESADQYTIDGLSEGGKQVSGQQLHQGLPVTIETKQEVRLKVGAPPKSEAGIQLLKQIDISPYRGSFVSPGDLDGDGKVDFLLSQMGPHTTPIRLVALDHEGEELWKLGEPAGKDGTQRANGEPTCRGIASVYDVDVDGRAEVLAELWRDGRPMLCLIEGATGKIEREISSPLDMSVRQPEGHRSSRPVPMALIVRANGPGGPPIIVLKYEASNTIPTRAVGVSHQLEMLWKHDLRPTATGHIPTVADLDGDGREEVVLGETAIDDDGTILWQQDFGIHADCTAVADVAPAEGQEVLVSICQKGPLYCLSAAEGKVLWQKSREEIPHGQAVGAGDVLPGHAGIEVIALRNGHIGDFVTLSGSDGAELTAFQHQGNLGGYPDFPTSIRWTGSAIHSLWLPIDRRIVDGTGKTVQDLGPFDKLVQEQLKCGLTKSHLAAQALAADVCGDEREELILYQPYQGKAIFLFTQGDSDGRPTPYANPSGSRSCLGAVATLVDSQYCGDKLLLPCLGHGRRGPETRR